MSHGVAIYATSSGTAGFYDRADGRDGGAERQMFLLARALAERGHRVAHVIYPPREQVELQYAVTLVHRAPRYVGKNRIVSSVKEAHALWRALRVADARVVVLRSASPLVCVAAIYCTLRRGKLIFSSSSVSDFTLETMESRWNRVLYRLGVRRADVVVVQSEDQLELARKELPSLRRVESIPSFAELPPAGSQNGRVEPDSFLWFGRSVEEKRPLRYVELARSLPEARFLMIPTSGGKHPHVVEELRAAAPSVPNLELLDSLPHAELAKLISRSVAVVNTSTLEGMPNAFLEAWARGVPVLTLEFDPDGVVARGGLGVAAGGSWDRFVGGARELWASRSSHEALSRRVRAHVEEKHSLDAVAARWDALIGELQRDG